MSEDEARYLRWRADFADYVAVAEAAARLDAARRLLNWMPIHLDGGGETLRIGKRTADKLLKHDKLLARIVAPKEEGTE